MWLCDNVAFYLSEVYPNNPVHSPLINDHVSIMWPTGNTFTPVRNMPGGSPGLSPRFSLAYSVVNPCIVVLAVEIVDKEAAILKYGVSHTIHNAYYYPLSELNGASSEEPKAKRGNLTSCGGIAESGMSSGQVKRVKSVVQRP